MYTKRKNFNFQIIIDNWGYGKLSAIYKSNAFSSAKSRYSFPWVQEFRRSKDSFFLSPVRTSHVLFILPYRLFTNLHLHQTPWSSWENTGGVLKITASKKPIFNYSETSVFFSSHSISQAQSFANCYYLGISEQWQHFYTTWSAILGSSYTFHI